MNSITRMLDIGCGPGGWVLDVAHTYPDKEVVGIDISKTVIQYATAQARVRKLRNAYFQLMDALKPLDFPDESFDLVNARTLIGFVPSTAWPHIVEEYKRVLRSGGILRMTETEGNFSNKPGLETASSLINLSLHRAGRGLSPTGRHLGVITVLPYLLRQAGFQHVQSVTHEIDCSYGRKSYTSTYEDYKLVLPLVKPLLLNTQVIRSEEEFEQLYEQVMTEMQLEDFCALGLARTAWGEKP
jgi:SAM-dependent methyltransferase